MELIPAQIGPLNPRVLETAVALVAFTCCYVALARLLPRIDRVLEAREEATEGATRRADLVRGRAEAVRRETLALLADARHDAADIRRRAREQGAALIAEARADALRERDRLLAEAAVRLGTDRAAAEEELRAQVPVWAEELAARVLGEPVTARSGPAAARSR
ncbi:hypothetical protein [Streptomyces sp. NPDC093094]|uniref:F0F1 ATP synthase subunit B family protein n=1 Tax=Streptomyces sp. NPDC093094 TaxID=3366026 RepID=UPI0037F8BEF2